MEKRLVPVPVLVLVLVGLLRLPGFNAGRRRCRESLTSHQSHQKKRKNVRDVALFHTIKQIKHQQIQAGHQAGVGPAGAGSGPVVHTDRCSVPMLYVSQGQLAASRELTPERLRALTDPSIQRGCTPVPQGGEINTAGRGEQPLEAAGTPTQAPRHLPGVNVRLMAGENAGTEPEKKSVEGPEDRGGGTRGRKGAQQGKTMAQGPGPRSGGREEEQRGESGPCAAADPAHRLRLRRWRWRWWRRGGRRSTGDQGELLRAAPRHQAVEEVEAEGASGSWRRGSPG